MTLTMHWADMYHYYGMQCMPVIAYSGGNIMGSETLLKAFSLQRCGQSSVVMLIYVVVLIWNCHRLACEMRQLMIHRAAGGCLMAKGGI